MLDKRNGVLRCVRTRACWVSVAKFDNFVLYQIPLERVSLWHDNIGMEHTKLISFCDLILYTL